MNPGDIITVRALHADGGCYRWWHATVESVNDGCIVTLTRPGHLVRDAEKGDGPSRWTIRAFYWLDKPYNLFEVYNATGELQEIYVNIASMPTIEGEALTYTDHELDVSLIAGQSARVVDQDEFEEAIVHYGYSAGFQAHCWQVAQQACALAEGWIPAGLPAD